MMQNLWTTSDRCTARLADSRASAELPKRRTWRGISKEKQGFGCTEANRGQDTEKGRKQEVKVEK